MIKSADNFWITVIFCGPLKNPHHLVNLSSFTMKNEVIPTFSWIQIMFSDVSYKIDRENKTVHVTYCQNLTHWWKELVEEIKSKV
jgi:hypothetical protein